MLAPQSGTLRVGPFTLDLARHVLLRDELELPLRRQSFDVLHHLAEHSGKVISRDDLVRAVWGNAPPHRPADSIAQCIKDIRQAMGDDARWMIRTIPGTGYEFKGEVQAAPAEVPGAIRPGDEALRPEADIANANGAAKPAINARQAGMMALAGLVLLAGGVIAWFRSGPPEAPKVAAPLEMLATPSVVVLPLETTAAEQAGVSAVLAEEIAAELLRAPRGFDISIKTAADLRGHSISPSSAARVLGVRYAVTGTLTDEGANRRILVRLIEAETGRQVWAEPFTYGAGEAGAQTLTASRISRMLSVQIRVAENRRPMPAQPAAGHYVIQGRVLLESERGEDVARRVKALYDKAVELDGNNVQALLGYSRIRVDTIFNGHMTEIPRATLFEESERAIDHAISVDQRSVGAHLLRGVIARARGNDNRAIASFEHVQSLNPNYALAHAELGRAKIEIGRSDETIGHLQRALELSPTDPASSVWFYWAGMAAAHMGDFKLSEYWLARATQANQGYKNPVLWLAIAYAGLGNDEKAREELREFLKHYPKYTLTQFNRLLPRRNPEVAVQRERLAEILRVLGLPES